MTASQRQQDPDQVLSELAAAPDSGPYVTLLSFPGS